MTQESGPSKTLKDGGVPHPYDAVMQEVAGQQILTHNTPESMAKALNQEQPDRRVMTFVYTSLLWLIQNVAFVDQQRRLHNFTATITTDEQAAHIKDSIWGIIAAKEYVETDGVYRVDDQTGDVYQVYETDRPDEVETIEAQVAAWAEDVRSASVANPNEGLLQYVTEEGATIVDFTQGRNHKVTLLHHAAGFTLASIMEDMPTIPMQDNGPVLRWAQAIKP